MHFLTIILRLVIAEEGFAWNERVFALCSWPISVGRALRSFVRARLVDWYTYPPGKMDQIMWLVAAPGALAGDRGYGSFGRLATRIGHLTDFEEKEVSEFYH